MLRLLPEDPGTPPMRAAPLRDRQTRLALRRVVQAPQAASLVSSSTMRPMITAPCRQVHLKKKMAFGADIT